MTEIDQLAPDFIAAYAHWLGVTEGEAYALLKEEPLTDLGPTEDVVAAGFEESEHPRWPKGHPDGGQFKPKEGSDDEGPNPDHWRGAVAEGEPVSGRLGDWQPIGSSPSEANDYVDDSGEPWGSARDPQWEGDPVGPSRTTYGDDVWEPFDHSDTVWSGRLVSEMPHDMDIDEYLRSIEGFSVEGEFPDDLAAYQQEVGEIMRDIGEEGELRITTPDGDVMDDIVESGRFKSQFETGSSGGVFYPDARAVQEEKFFGYPKDIPPEQRPIYGWVDHPDRNEVASSIHQYGNVTWLLKDELRSRTTVSFQDSLSRPVIPGPIRNPGYRASVPPGYIDSATLGPITDLITETGLHDDGAIEAQYHGGLTLDDVQGVRIQLQTVERPPAIREHAATLRARGIRVEVYDLNGELVDSG